MSTKKSRKKRNEGIAGLFILGNLLSKWRRTRDKDKKRKGGPTRRNTKYSKKYPGMCK